MIPFNASKVAFGHHETFPLRFGWISKGYMAWCENPEVFDQDDPTVVLGVGKNMVTAIRYWMRAAQIVNDENAGITPTVIGQMLFSKSTGWDVYLEDDATLWITHWLIASNPKDATTLYWFFNRYHKPEFTSSELSSALTDFVRENVKSRVAQSTQKHDINVLLRMYGPSEKGKGVPIEEGLDSPMTTLGLISRAADGKHFISRVSERRRLPLVAFGFAVLDLMESLNQTSIPVERLLHADNQYAAPGSIFRMTEEGLITKLEELVLWMAGIFELRETAGIHQLYQLQPCSKYNLIPKHYLGANLEKAA